MTVEQHKVAQRARYFTMHKGDGRAFSVKHPDFMSRSPSGRTVIVHADDDSSSVLNVLLVNELETHPMEKTSSAA